MSPSRYILGKRVNKWFVGEVMATEITSNAWRQRYSYKGNLELTRELSCRDLTVPNPLCSPTLDNAICTAKIQSRGTITSVDRPYNA